MLVSHASRGWEIQDQGASWFSSWWEASSWWTDSRLLIRSSRGPSLEHACWEEWGGDRGRERFPVASFSAASFPSWVAILQSLSHVDSLQPHGLQHTRLPYPLPALKTCSSSCPLSRWCHPTISSSVDPFSSCPQSLPASGSFPVSWLFTSGGQSSGIQPPHQSLQWIFRTDLL